MKRDMDLIRDILIRIEDVDNLPGDLDLSFANHSQQTVSYHIHLLVEANLVQAIDTSATQDESYLVTGLTWDGHDFLDASRDDSRWQAAKDLIAEKGGGMVFEVLKNVLVKLLSEQLQ